MLRLRGQSLVLQSARRRITRQPAPRPRTYASGPPQSQPTGSDTKGGPAANIVTETFQQNLLFTVDFFKRAAYYSFLALVGVGLTTYAAYEGTHLYVESFALSPSSDPDAAKWEWDREEERWTGDPIHGGTDHSLGFRARHAVRGAWMAQNWGTGATTNGIFVPGGRVDGELNAIDSRLQIAHDFLNNALTVALKDAGARVRPQTILDLLTRRASVLERIGSRTSLFEARSDLERVWAGTSAKGPESARISLKLADLSWRLGDAEEASDWWARTIHLLQPTKRSEIPSPFTRPESLPTSPMGQRTLVSAFVSLSAFLSTTGKLKEAAAYQESILRLLQPAVTTFVAESSPSPAEILHKLYLAHRTSLIHIHHAEVLHALRKSPSSMLFHLRTAVTSAEHVAFTLTGTPSIHPDAPSSTIPPPPTSSASLVPAFAIFRTMRTPSASLLRDARRTAAEAWNLMGLLIEKDSPAQALECYERALGWVGASTGSGDPDTTATQAGEVILESDWRAMWSNYVRVRGKGRREESSK